MDEYPAPFLNATVHLPCIHQLPRALLAIAGGLLVLHSPVAGAGPIAEAFQARRVAATSDEGDNTFLEPDGGQSAARLPPGTRVERDVAYGPDSAQRLDVYLPAQAQAAPVVFMVHGGAWMVGDKAAAKVVDNKVAHWLPQGVALVSINYRMSRSPRVLDQVDDVARALALVQARASGWGLDTRRVLVMGHSAGAHLVALMTSDPALATAHGTQPWLGTVALDSAALDVPQIMQKRHYGFYDRVFGADPVFWASVSPLQRLQATPVVPMLLVCSSRRSDSCPPAHAFAARAQGLGGTVTVLPVNLSHADVNGTLGLDGPYTRAVDDFARKSGFLGVR